MDRRPEDYPLSRENWERTRSLLGDIPTEQYDANYELDPDFARICIRFVHEHMYSRSILSQKTRELCAVSALTVLDKPQLYGHIKAAVNAGASREETLEAIIQMLVYCGVPSTTNAINLYRRVIAEMAAADPDSPAAKGPNPPPPLENDGLSIGERALKTGTRMYGEEQARRYIDELEEVDPGLSQMFQELVYGGMYSRQVLDSKTRQLLAVAACVVSNALPQLESHARVGLRVGLSVAEIREVIFQMVVYVGFPYTVQAFRRFSELVASAR